MKVKLNWLKELVDLEGISTKEIVDTLSLHSIEIESVENVLYGTNLTIGHVLTCVDHPDSDHLHVCTIDCGSEVLQIVCGAPNIKEGLYVIVALIGCELPGGFKIKKSKIRGVESNGMVCSLSELGMEKKYIEEKYAQGIYYFEKEVKAGDNPLKELELEDEVIELGLTPNRGDLLSMIGVAYEVSAVFNRPLKKLAFDLVDTNNDKGLVDVQIETDKCLAYYAKVIKDVKIKQSPQWLISRLIAFGIRPINNVVDITNYILALFGQPLHAFDYKLLGNKILVRQALENEEIITLDGIKRSLLTTDVVITDGVKPVALAGVMGGLNSSITDDTKDVVIEAAVFDPVSIRKTFTRLDLRSESSIRFEKGVDVNRTKLALDYTCYLFKELCDAKISEGVSFAGVKEKEPVEVEITSDYISKYLGVEISNAEVLDIMKRLQFETAIDKDIITIKVPNRRFDVAIKQDIVEEVGRIFGYEQLPVTLPKTSSAGQLTNYQNRRRILKHVLKDLGLVEAVNYSLLENNNDFKFLYNKDEQNIELMLPISNERKVLRRNLTSSILENVRYSFNRKLSNCAFFEIGKVYYKDINYNYIEREHLVVALSNVFSSTLWNGKVEVVDFYLIKGLITKAFSEIGIEFDYEKLEVEEATMHPLRTAKVLYNNKMVGFIGEIHPKYAQENDLKNVYVCEIDIHDLLHQEKESIIYTPVSKVPNVERDLAFVLNKEVSAKQLVNAIKEVDKKMITDVIIFDLYVGEKVAKDEKSIACKIILSSNETLTDEIVNAKVSKILKTLEKNNIAKLRA